MGSLHIANANCSSEYQFIDRDYKVWVEMDIFTYPFQKLKH